ncbi:SRPBCC domain-containing protein [Nodosilinea sp. FACHB-131]|uniref:SRPBCC domain-containing protein n=1 Tax=Cyanophyceae TaxID=3028117 RepID=UPI001685CE54|nr:SRPBCC domain-containing protein [Nodosilinea sp. FACHB-131]MBD1875555.1 SRPBCC domain-containing protein [Nodosilinea sp. FACHB-131]
MANASTSTPQSDREIVITRLFNAPRDLVWQAWTDPAHIAQWWGPEGFTTRVEEMDLRPGGQSRYVMVGPDGTEYPVQGVFREVVPPERIVTTDEFGEGYEEITDIDLPQGMVITILFEDLGDQTKLALHISHPTAEERRKHEEMGVVAGWNSTLDCLAEHLTGVTA